MLIADLKISMDLNNYLLYLLVSVGYIASPGPAVFLAINGGATIGVKRTAALLAGNTIGLGLMALIAALGVGTLILNSVGLTAIVKIIGALWLAHLGIKMLRTPTSPEHPRQKTYATANYLYQFRDGLVLALTNPKVILFFISIYPQFIVINDFETHQFLLLGLTFMLLSFGILNVYSLLSKLAIGQFLNTKNKKKMRVFNYFFGCIFLLLALFFLVETWRLNYSIN